MKRVVCLFLILAMALALTACAEQKSAAVRKTEGMISAMGEVSAVNLQAVLMVREQVATLTSEERGQVSNIQQFYTAWAEYVSHCLIEGETWVWSSIDYYDPENLHVRPYICVFADGSYETNAFDEGVQRTGAWHVDHRGWLLLTDADGKTIDVDTHVENGKLVVMENWIPVAEYEAMVRERVLIVEVTAENWSDYMELGLFEETVLDAFGDPTGEVTVQLMLMSKLYDDGWLCYDSKDFAIELILPEHGYSRIDADGTENTGTYGADTMAVTTGNVPFAYKIMTMQAMSAESTFERDLSLDDIQVGRVMGKLYFVRAENVLSTRMEGGWRYMELDQGCEVPVWHIEGLNY